MSRSKISRKALSSQMKSRVVKYKKSLTGLWLTSELVLGDIVHGRQQRFDL